MAANISSGAIAALASLFIVAPLPSDPSIEISPLAIQHPAAADTPATKPQFPEPTFRTLELPLTEPFIGFKGPLNSVTIADDEGGPVTQVAVLDPAPANSGRGSIPVEPAPAARARAVDFAEPVIAEPSLFDTAIEEFPGAVPVAVPRLGANPKWRRIIEENPKPVRSVECADTAERCAASPWARWNDLVRKVSALAGEERLQAVNEGVNSLLTYASDDEIYGVGDYWATLEESLARGRGDCEDIAIAKMWLLKAAGIDLSSMRLVVLKDTLRNLDHAVLSVVENGHQYVLDNTAWKVGRADWMRGYRPIYALSSAQSWIYGMRVPAAPPLQVAQSAAPQLPQ